MKVPKHRHGSTVLKSIHVAGISSVPKTQRSKYLELYSLGREKSRLTKEKLALDTRRETISKHLDSIGRRMLTLQREMVQEQEAQMGARTTSQPIQVVDINY